MRPSNMAVCLITFFLHSKSCQRQKKKAPNHESFSSQEPPGEPIHPSPGDMILRAVVDVCRMRRTPEEEEEDL